MPTTDGYNGAYTGPQIDEGISKASTSMQPSVYDPQNKAQDVFGYVDSVAEGLIEYVEFTYVSGNNPDTVSSSRTFTEVKESINSGRLVLGRYGNYFYSVVSHDNSSVTFLCVTAVNYARTIILTLTNSASATYSNQNPLLKSGGTMTGPLTLSGDPAEDLQAAPKQYVDALRQLLVQKAGDTMTGPLVLPGNPTANLQAAPKQYIDSVASTLNTALASRARIQTGSYVGTGTYGSSNPCSLTFDFMPQLFILFGKTNSNANYRNMIIAIKGGTQLAFMIGSGSNPSEAGASGLTFSWGSKTLNWYATYLNNQLNASGVTYNWLAAGA